MDTKEKFLHFIGNGSGFAFEKYNNCAYKIIEDELFLFDCGNNIIQRIIQLKLFDKAKKIYIIITHFHDDHIGSLSTACLYLKYLLNKDFSVIYPYKQKLKNLLKIMGVNFKVNIKTIKMFNKHNSNLKLCAVKNKHSNMDSFGYICYFNSKKLYYSGDCCNVNKKALKLFLNNDIDEFYHEVCEEKNNVHTCIDELECCIPYNKRKNVYLMHLFDNTIEKYKSYGFNIASIDN